MPLVRGAVPPAPGCTTPGRWPRARLSSMHRRDTLAGADGRSAAGSMTSPTVGPGGGPDPVPLAGPSAAASPMSRRSSRPLIESSPTGSHAGPRARTRAGPLALALLVRICSVVPWAHPLKIWRLQETRGGSVRWLRARPSMTRLTWAVPSGARCSELSLTTHTEQSHFI